MKSIILFFTIICSLQMADAQLLKVPALSPACKIEQKLGLGEITIEYSRPSARGRQIFGDLVPYDVYWRTAANANTVIKFSDDVKVNNVPLKKGAYALFTVPSKNKDWEVIIYDDAGGWPPKKIDESKVISRFNIPAHQSATYEESFTIGISDLTTTSANITIKWAEIILKIPVEVPGDQMAMKNIDNLMNGPSADDLYDAASYYFHNGKDINKALEWSRKAGEMYTWDAYWPHYLEAQILAKLKRYDEAIIKGQKASDFVKKAGYTDVGDQIDLKLRAWKKM